MQMIKAIWSVKIIFVSVFVSGHFCARSEFSRPDGKDPEIPQLESMVSEWGYPIETYEVRTDDNYLLTVFRIPNTKSTKSPVFLQHGIHASAAHFLANKRALAYYLLMDGFDIWVGNGRGTKFSQGHVKLSSLDNEYWNFSFHEMGEYDLPAVLKFIRDTTKKDKVHYVAHSMGTTMFLVMACVKPKELNHIHSVTFLAPVARPKHMGLMEKTFKKIMADTTVSFLKTFGVKKIPVPKKIGLYARKWCSGEGNLPNWCRKKLSGQNPENFDYDSVLLHKAWWLFDDVSLKTHIHFLQIATSGRFQHYDYGLRKNKKLYKTFKPKLYNLQSIKKRIYLISGGADSMATEKDVGWLHSKLRHPWLIKTDFEDFEHSHFNYGEKIEKLNTVVGILINAAENNKDPDIPKDTPIKPTSDSSSSSEEAVPDIKVEDQKQSSGECHGLNCSVPKKKRRTTNKSSRSKDVDHHEKDDQRDKEKDEKISSLERMLGGILDLLTKILQFLGLPVGNTDDKSEKGSSTLESGDQMVKMLTQVVDPKKGPQALNPAEQMVKMLANAAGPNGGSQGSNPTGQMVNMFARAVGPNLVSQGLNAAGQMVNNAQATKAGPKGQESIGGPSPSLDNKPAK